MVRLDAMLPKLAALGADHGVERSGVRAAVAAILRERPGDAGTDLFFIRRAEHPDDPWSGHIAFPGGRRDPGDESLLATAIRETREEVGIELTRDQLLGRLPELPAFSRRGTDGLVVVPFVFGLRTDVPITPNVEVAGTLWVPVATLARAEGRTTFKLDHGGTTYDLPCMHLEPGGHRLWGLTFRMLETLLETII